MQWYQLIIPLIIWLLPVGSLFIYSNFKVRYTRKLNQMKGLLQLTDKGEFVKCLGELVVSMTSKPVLVGRFLPEKEGPVTDQDCYEHFHYQFIFQQEMALSPLGKLWKTNPKAANLIFIIPISAVAYVPLLAGKNIPYILLVLTLPLTLLMVAFLKISSLVRDYTQEKMHLLLEIDGRFAEFMLEEVKGEKIG